VRRIDGETRRISAASKVAMAHPHKTHCARLERNDLQMRGKRIEREKPGDEHQYRTTGNGSVFRKRRIELDVRLMRLVQSNVIPAGFAARASRAEPELLCPVDVCARSLLAPPQATKACRRGPRSPPQRRRPVAGGPGLHPSDEDLSPGAPAWWSRRLERRYTYFAVERCEGR